MSYSVCRYRSDEQTKEAVKYVFKFLAVILSVGFDVHSDGSFISASEMRSTLMINPYIL